MLGRNADLHHGHLVSVIQRSVRQPLLILGRALVSDLPQNIEIVLEKCQSLAEDRHFSDYFFFGKLQNKKMKSVERK